MANTLTHSPADILRRLLIALGLGTDPSDGAAWPVFATSEPSSPDETVTVYDTTGSGMGRRMTDGRLVRYPGFQVRVRARNHTTGWLKTDEIQRSLAEDVYQETVTFDAGAAYLVHAVVRIGDVLPIGPEPSSKRFLFTLNAEAVIRQLAD